MKLIDTECVDGTNVRTITFDGAPIITANNHQLYQCPYCNHRIEWNPDKILVLRYCWSCGKYLLVDNKERAEL